EESTVPQVRELLTKLVSALPESDVDGNAAPKPEPLDPTPEARTAPVPVAFNVRTFKTIRYTHPDAPALLVLANYLRDTFLHRERFKQRLLQVTADDLTRVSSSYLAAGRGVQATVAGAELIAAAQKEHPGLFEVVAPV